MTVKNIEEKNTKKGITFFTGIILYQDEKLDFMFDLNYQQLFIFEWNMVSREVTKKIWESMCKIFHAGLGVEELELEI